MRQSTKTALGGIFAALMLVILFLFSVFPSLTIAAPAVASMLMLFVVLEIGKGWALAVYFVVSVLALILIPAKEAAILYVVFFGYYPILKQILEKYVRLRVLEWAIKILLFAGIMFGAYYLMIRFMGIEFDEIDKYGRAAVPLLLGVGTFAFAAYDFCLTLFVGQYLRRWQKHFKKLFRLK